MGKMGMTKNMNKNSEVEKLQVDLCAAVSVKVEKRPQNGNLCLT
jgi:hypothetical protein